LNRIDLGGLRRRKGKVKIGRKDYGGKLGENSKRGIGRLHIDESY
jgi:hypothetical protein